LKPKHVREERISQQALYYQKSPIKNGKNLNIKQKFVIKLLGLYKQTMLNNKNKYRLFFIFISKITKVFLLSMSP